MSASPLGCVRRLAATLLATTLTLAVGVGTAAAGHAGETGIDVSRWQHGTSIDWAAVRADGVRFSFIKATEGSYYTNPYFASDWAATERVGLYRAAYHFARPSIGSAATQARYFVSKAGTHADEGDLPPVLDLESSGGLSVSQLQTWARTWLVTVRKLTGRTPIIYTGPYFWESSMGNSTAFTEYPLWVAHYSTQSPRVPGGWPTWTFWQSTDQARIDGISGNVDKNTFNGSLTQLKRLANITPTAPTPPPPDVPDAPEPAPTKITTSTSVDLNRDAVYRGRPVTVSGEVTTSAGEAMTNRRVRVLRRESGSSTWSRIAALRTDASGRYAVTTPVTDAASYKAVYPGYRAYVRSTSTLAEVDIRPKMVVRPTLNLEGPGVRRSGTVKLYGHLVTSDGAPVTGKPVALYRRLAGSVKWTRVGDGTSLAPTGWYQDHVRASRSATYKAVFDGALRYTKATSNRVTVTVR